MKTIILNFQIKTLYIRQSPKKGQQKRGKLPPFHNSLSDFIQDKNN